ncbi:MAG: hypothetical protein ABI397_02950 [Candidatus Saccharimonas sp.]
MAEEKQTPEIVESVDVMTSDDTDMLRYVIEHTQGTSAVSFAPIDYNA